MPLVADGATDSPGQLRALRAQIRAALNDVRADLEPGPGAPDPTGARARTARELVDDALALTGAPAEGLSSERLAAEVNLLYDVQLVAAEYYKLFVRPPTAARPAGRI